ncbi:uncharacterized protein LOC112505958 [Cynara cardunculus var. scolymus]|uniref:uncharacterized protein LOC112505958 n=1 Tax=Cynara cardunculus var. scolymus TaxID=59895 RepID=UPI000D62B158|nr:uncharacterized protein LOC112505958 [Cynara cardunculus var. scolymus]
MPLDQNDPATLEGISSTSASLDQPSPNIGDTDSGSSSSSNNPNRKTRSLRDLYDNTRHVNIGDLAGFDLFADSDPLHYEEACLDKKWRDAMDREMDSIMKNNTWELIDLPKGQKSIGAPRAWYSRIKGHFLDQGFKKCNYEHTLCIKKEGNTILIVCIYVDDLVFIGNSLEKINEFKDSMKENFEMTYLGLSHYFLGIEATQGAHCITISHKKYARDLLQRFNMEDCISAATPMEFGLKLSKEENGKEVDSTVYRSFVGCLMYLTASRPDIMLPVTLVSRFMEHPKKQHLEAARRILRHVKGTLDHGITYSFSHDFKLIGYSDSDYGGDIVDSRSTAGYVFSLGSGVISWQSKKQKVVALSSTEAEYMALSSKGCQTLWLRGILQELGISQSTCTQIFCVTSLL